MSNKYYKVVRDNKTEKYLESAIFFPPQVGGVMYSLVNYDVGFWVYPRSPFNQFLCVFDSFTNAIKFKDNCEATAISFKRNDMPYYKDEKICFKIYECEIMNFITKIPANFPHGTILTNAVKLLNEVIS